MRKDLFDIGIQFRENAFPGETWQTLNEKHGHPFKNGEVWRNSVRKELKKKNSQPSNGVKDEADGVEDKQTTEQTLSLKPNKHTVRYEETVQINKDGSQTSDKLINMSLEDSKSPEFLLKAHGYSAEDWELVSAKNSMWHGYAVDTSGEFMTKVLYSSRISVRPRTESISLEELMKELNEFSKRYKSPIHKPSNYQKNGKMLEVNIADLHVGKLAWAGETGENYDTKIASQRFMEIINDIITRTKDYKFEKILFVWSNDFFHYDTIDVTTTAGTRQDSDVRWPKLFVLGYELLIQGIDLLSQLAPVETFYLASNHDKMTSFYANCVLHAWYHKNPNISVDTDPQGRKYIEFGNCLIGFGHGDNEKKRIGKLMPIDAREAWGRTKYHEFHAAHIHSEKAVEEENGIIVRYISSPTSTDAWHYDSGYIGAVKKAQSFIWDRKKGLTDILHSVIEEAS